MFRFILYTLLLIIVISIVKSVVGAVMKSFGDFAGRPDAPPRAKGRQSSAQLGGDLHRDPVCGTFVAESTAFQRRLGAQTFYYCSNACREKHALVAK